MDTKLKRFNGLGNVSKNVLFIACVVSFITAMTGGILAVTLYGNTCGLYNYNIWNLLNPGSGMANDGINYYAVHGDVLVNVASAMRVFLVLSIVGFVAALVTFVALLIKSSGRDEDGNVVSPIMDKLFTEIQFVATGFLLVAGGWLFGMFMYSAATNMSVFGFDTGYDPFAGSILGGSPMGLKLLLAILLGLIVASLGLWLIVSVVRKMRNGTFFRYSIFGLFIFEPLKKLYRGGGTLRRAIIISLFACLLSATGYGSLIVFGAILVLGPRWFEKYDSIKAGVAEVNSGNLTYQIPIDENSNSELDSLGREINHIFTASNEAVQNEIKNQRMKTELISNVSHDLRTPLTSIITYIDLLKTEGLKSENAPEYLDVLDQKSQRLKQLTDDLFEAAKASSGAMPVEFGKLELMSLIRQCLGEFDMRIEESDLTFVVNASKDKFYAMADGMLMSRVMENLITNALKYAQPGTRVYVDVTSKPVGSEGKNVIFLEIKNVSRSALNINADELMERFKRGDEARTSDGSGLGLSIAKDLIKLQKGWLELKIDGDLFKAIITIEEVEAPPAEAAADMSAASAIDGVDAVDANANAAADDKVKAEETADVAAFDPPAPLA